VAPGHEKAFPAGNPKVLAIVGVFPFGETALVTFLSLERFNIADIILLPTDKTKKVHVHLVETFGTLVAFIIVFKLIILDISGSTTNLIEIAVNCIHLIPFVMG
jgi:hypothetical protein